LDHEEDDLFIEEAGPLTQENILNINSAANFEQPGAWTPKNNEAIKITPKQFHIP